MATRLKNGDLVQVRVGSLGADGLASAELDDAASALGGVAAPAGSAANGTRTQAPALVVGNALPQETGSALVIHAGARRSVLRMVDLSSPPHPARVEPSCPRWTPASPCQLLHMSKAAQLELKRAQVQSAVGHLAPTPNVSDCVSHGAALGWRSRITYAMLDDRGKAELGAYRRGSHQVQPMLSCLLPEPALLKASERIQALLQDYLRLLPRGKVARDDGCGEPASVSQLKGTLGRKFPAPRAGTPPALLEHLTLRSSAKGQVMACYLGKIPSGSAASRDLAELCERTVSQAGVHSVYAGPSGPGDAIFGASAPTWMAGAKSLWESVDGLEFELLPRTFFQVHRAAAARLQRDTIDLVVGTRVLDVFSGVGALALRAAKQGKVVTAIEAIPEAIQLGNSNAERNGVSVTFVLGDATAQLAALSPGFDTILVNPPRKGLGSDLAGELGRLKPQRLLYISCNPRSLARDLADLAVVGYVSRELRPYDLFPGSEHVETLAVLEPAG